MKGLQALVVPAGSISIQRYAFNFLLLNVKKAIRHSLITKDILAEVRIKANDIIYASEILQNVSNVKFFDIERGGRCWRR